MSELDKEAVEIELGTFELPHDIQTIRRLHSDVSELRELCGAHERVNADHIGTIAQLTAERDELRVIHERDAKEYAMPGDTQTIRRLHAEVKRLNADNERLRAELARSARIAEARAVAQYARKLAENGIRKPRGKAADDARVREILAKLDEPPMPPCPPCPECGHLHRLSSCVDCACSLWDGPGALARYNEALSVLLPEDRRIAVNTLLRGEPEADE